MFFKEPKAFLYSVKGRCMRVSLLKNFITFFFNNKTKKSLPGAQAVLFCSHMHNQRETPSCICQKGSITVEASVILPLFVGFFVALLFFFRIMQVQLVIQGVLEETGRSMAVLSVKELEETEAEIEYLGLAKAMVYLKLREEELIEQYVIGGAAGVNLLASEFKGDYILLNANYVMNFPIRIFGRTDFLLSQRTRYRKWNGWHSQVDVGFLEEWVYVTEYGEVYHMRRSCPYLELSIQKIGTYELSTKRNLNGEVYEACERCKVGPFSEMVYITDYGEKYHYSLECGGLKRIIYQKRRSDVGSMEACKKCSK